MQAAAGNAGDVIPAANAIFIYDNVVSSSYDVKGAIVDRATGTRLSNEVTYGAGTNSVIRVPFDGNDSGTCPLIYPADSSSSNLKLLIRPSEDGSSFTYGASTHLGSSEDWYLTYSDGLTGFNHNGNEGASSSIRSLTRSNYQSSFTQSTLTSGSDASQQFNDPSYQSLSTAVDGVADRMIIKLSGLQQIRLIDTSDASTALSTYNLTNSFGGICKGGKYCPSLNRFYFVVRDDQLATSQTFSLLYVDLATDTIVFVRVLTTLAGNSNTLPLVFDPHHNLIICTASSTTKLTAFSFDDTTGDTTNLGNNTTNVTYQTYCGADDSFFYLSSGSDLYRFDKTNSATAPTNVTSTVTANITFSPYAMIGIYIPSL